MNHSQKPGLSFDVAVNELHGVLRADAIRSETLVQLVQHWHSDDKARDEVIAALDGLADVVASPRREGELDAALEDIEEAAAMDTAYIEVDVRDARRLLDELTEVVRRIGRFNPKRLLPGQRSERGAA